MQESNDVYQQAANLLAASQRFETRLAQLRARIDKLDPETLTEVRSLLVKLRGANTESVEQHLEDGLTQEERQFVQRMRERRIPKHIIEFLIKTMLAVILDPRTKGTRLTDDVHAGAFSCKLRKAMGARYSQKVHIYKTNLPENYRLVYSHGPGLSRPVFLDFATRKDIYKHNGFGKTTS